MLITKVSVNTDQIEEIQIQRVGKVAGMPIGAPELYEYMIIKPEGF